MKLITITFAAAMVFLVYAEKPDYVSDLTAALDESVKENKVVLLKSARNYVHNKIDEMKEKVEKMIAEKVLEEIKGPMEMNDQEKESDHVSDLKAALDASLKDSEDIMETAKKSSNHESEVKTTSSEAVVEKKDDMKSVNNPVEDISTFDSKKIAKDIEKTIFDALQKDLAAKLDAKQIIKKKLDVQKTDKFQTELDRLLKEAEEETLRKVEKDLEGHDEFFDSNVNVKKDSWWLRRRRLNFKK